MYEGRACLLLLKTRPIMKILFVALLLLHFWISPALGQWTHDPGPEGGFVVNFDKDSTWLYALTSNSIYKSEDEGYHWTFVKYLQGAGKGLLRLTVEQGRMYGLDVNGELLRSLDHGKSWQVVLKKPAVVAGSGADRLQCLTVKADTVMVGSLFKVYYSYDGGETWAVSGTFFGAGVLSVLPLGGEWFVWNGGKVFRSSNGGQSWELVFSTAQPLAKVETVGDRIFLFYWEGNRLIRSKNGLRSWETIQTDTIPDVYDLFDGFNRARIVGDRDTLYCFIQGLFGYNACLERFCYSIDGGLHWNRGHGTTNTAIFYNDIVSFGGHLVFAHEQGVAHTVDGARSFSVDQQNLKSVSITNLALGDNHIAAEGLQTVFNAEGNTLKWEEILVNVTSGSCGNYKSILSTRQRWFLTGFNNNFLYSEDDGASWEKRYISSFWLPQATSNCIQIQQLNGISHFCDGSDEFLYTNLTSYLNGSTIDNIITSGEYMIALLSDNSVLLLGETGAFLKRIPPSPCDERSIDRNNFWEFDGKNLFRFCGANTYVYTEDALEWRSIYPQDWITGVPLYRQNIVAHGSQNGLLWLGVEGHGLYYTPDATGRFYPLSPQLPYPYPTAFAFKGNEIWVGTDGSGIYHLPLPPVHGTIKKGAIFKILPNPTLAGDILHLSSDQFLTQYTTLRVFDTAGRLVANSDLPPANQWELDFPNLIPGLYWIALNTSGNSTVLKWVALGRR